MVKNRADMVLTEFHLAVPVVWQTFQRRGAKRLMQYTGPQLLREQIEQINIGKTKRKSCGMLWHAVARCGKPFFDVLWDLNVAVCRHMIIILYG